MADSPITPLSPEQQSALCDIEEALDSARLVVQAVELGLQSHRIDSDVANSLTWVLGNGIDQIKAVEARLEAFRKGEAAVEA